MRTNTLRLDSPSPSARRKGEILSFSASRIWGRESKKRKLAKSSIDFIEARIIGTEFQELAWAYRSPKQLWKPTEGPSSASASEGTVPSLPSACRWIGESLKPNCGYGCVVSNLPPAASILHKVKNAACQFTNVSPCGIIAIAGPHTCR